MPDSRKIVGEAHQPVPIGYGWCTSVAVKCQNLLFDLFGLLQAAVPLSDGVPGGEPTEVVSQVSQLFHDAFKR
ncbi:MAG: hypothetical protein JO022_20970 [Acidobacteriaceae bacterium]|nr:hypothetical protein [Acidobacteriaceae bacterium]